MPIWDGKNYLQGNENDFLHETIRLQYVSPNNAQKCVTIQWPSTLNFKGKPMVSGNQLFIQMQMFEVIFLILRFL